MPGVCPTVRHIKLFQSRPQSLHDRFPHLRHGIGTTMKRHPGEARSHKLAFTRRGHESANNGRNHTTACFFSVRFDCDRTQSRNRASHDSPDCLLQTSALMRGAGERGREGGDDSGEGMDCCNKTHVILRCVSYSGHEFRRGECPHPSHLGCPKAKRKPDYLGTVVIRDQRDGVLPVLRAYYNIFSSITNITLTNPHIFSQLGTVQDRDSRYFPA